MLTVYRKHAERAQVTARRTILYAAELSGARAELTMLNYDQLMALRMEVHQTFTKRDTMLYALGVGVGIQVAADPAQLRFVYEEGLVALPTMAAVLGSPGFWIKDAKYNVDWRRMLHGEQCMEFQAPLPTEGTVVGVTTIERILDKGRDKGAIIYQRRELFDERTGALLATVRSANVLRGNGGFGGARDGAPDRHTVPSDRSADFTVELPTRPEQSLIYRLSGDYQPLHADPGVARSAGFDRPILHGLCTYGIVGRAVLKALCAEEPSRLKRLDVRFSKPVYPGETLVVELWREADNRAALQARVKEHGMLVIQDGLAEF